MNVDTNTTVAARRMFYGWWVVIAGTLLYALGIGSVFYGFSTFYNPMISEFGWSSTATSGAYSLSRLEGGVEGPVIGWLIDKFGARKLAFIGVILAGIGFFALLLVNSNVLTLYLIFGLLLSIGFETGFFHATTTAVGNWFVRRRSQALSYVTSGGGVGGAILVPLMAWLITQVGWRPTAVIIGAMMLALGLPLVYLLRSRPEDKGLLPDGDPPATASVDAAAPLPASAQREIDFTLSEALHTSTFWIYVAAMSFRATILSSLVVHEIPHLKNVGFEYQAAANALGSMILISVAGRLVFGWLGDRIQKRFLLLISCLFQAAGIWILIHAQAPNLAVVYAFVVVYGIGYGAAIPLTIALRGELFGRKAFASVGGITTFVTAIGSVGAPVLAGYVFDVTHSYTTAFYLFIVLIVIAGFIFLLVRRPKPPARLRASGAV